MIVPMKRVRIAALHHEAEQVISILSGLGVFHVSSPEKDPVFMFEPTDVGFISKDTADTLAQAESLIASISTALNSLPSPMRGQPTHATPKGGWIAAEQRERIQQMVDEISETARNLERGMVELKEVRVYRDVFMEFSGLIEVVASSTDVDLVGVAFPKEGARGLEELEVVLEKATGGVYSMFRSKNEGQIQVALMVIPITMWDTVSQKVFAGKIHPIHLPQRYSKSTFASTLAALLERDRELSLTVNRLEASLAQMSGERRLILEAARKGLIGETAPLHAQEKLIHSDRVFWISGWAPERDAEKIAIELESVIGPSALIYASRPEVEQWEHAPVKLSNPRWARPFERIVDLYAPPVYGSVDPTVFLAITFPLFFGLIMGDVGHAALLALVGWGVSRIPDGGSLARDAAAIIYRLAGTAALFGLVFGEFWGEFAKHTELYTPLFDRKHGAGSMLAVVLFIGFFHVAMGAFLGLVNAARRKNWREGLEKMADIMMLVCLFWLGWQVSEGLVTSAAIWAMVIVFAVKVAAGWSVKSALEAPRLVSNILSYTRLMALGLAAIAMGDLANDFLRSGMASGVAAGVAFHALNFVIGVVGPVIQSVRLHYVEFFSQFFEPAMVRYRPLADPAKT
ncbi:MAG: hypothetical protein OEZ32_12835 [Nitrospinota bacterium]|nr:hypothetical protein [Nitrospinota bacterium]